MLSCVQFLQPRGMQHNRLSCPSPLPRICSNSCPLSWFKGPSNHLNLCHDLLLWLHLTYPNFRKTTEKNMTESQVKSLLSFVQRKRIVNSFYSTFQNTFSSIQSLSHVQLFLTPWTAACQVSLSIANSWSWLQLVSIE